MIFAFGDFELDQARFELRRAGHVVPTQPKVLRLLFLLVAERQRVVTDDELLKTLWPNEKVERASIKRAVMGARIALGDRSQASIRTVPRHGYRFGAPVEERAAPEPGRAPAREHARTPAFVGREAVLAELGESLTRALAGDGHCVLIFGEPGIGKTRILAELSARAVAQGAHVWLGRCMEFDGAPAFWPLQQILREATQALGDAQLRSLLGAGAADVAEALPELRQSVDGLAAPPAIDAARFRFFESITRFLLRAANEKPVVLLVDDLHRADPSSVRFLLFLLEQLGSAPLLLVACLRPSEQRDGESRGRIAELLRARGTRSVELTGLSDAEVAQFIAQRTGAPAPASALARMVEQTAGNPLFIEEILRSLRVSASDWPSVGVAWEGLGQLARSLGLRGAIERHVAMLSPACRALLVSAAVLGQEFSVALLGELVALPGERVLVLLSEASQAGVLRVRAHAAGVYRFTHALIRDALYETSEPTVRAQRHAAVGLMLEARGAAGDDAELARLAEHFWLAAPAFHCAKALDYARSAAERAMRRLAYEEASLHFARALQLLALGAHDPSARLTLLLSLGEALALGAEPARARATLLQVVALARELHAFDVLAQAARWLGRSRESGTVDRALEALLRELLAALPEGDPRTPGLVALLAKALSFSGDCDERARLALSALALSTRLEHAELRAETLFACHEALAAPDHAEQRGAIARTLRQLAQRHGDARTMMYALIAQAQNGVERGDVASLDSVIGALEALAQRVRDPVVRWYTQIYCSTRAMIAGRFAEAERSAAEALLLGRAIEEEMAHHGYCAQVTGLFRLQGRSVEAQAIVSDMVARFPSLAGWRAVSASMHADAGRKQLAHEMFTELLADDLAMVWRDPYSLSALCPLAELCVRVGDAREAAVLHRALDPYARFHGNVSFGVASYGPISLQLAQLKARMGDFEAAARHAGQALAEAERMASPTFTALAALANAYALFRQGSRANMLRVRALGERARGLADGVGMHVVARQSAGLLRALPEL